MKIYTKTGDTGETSLFGGERVKKSHPRVQTYGTLDEANSTLGLAISLLPPGSEQATLQANLIRIQGEIFQIGAELASPKMPASLVLVTSAEITQLEKEIDEMEKTLEPLKNFILQGGHPAGATLHLARTIIRRGERECVELTSIEPIRSEVVQYLNRLSDYLFVAARYLNRLQNTVEHPWIPQRNVGKK